MQKFTMHPRGTLQDHYQLGGGIKICWTQIGLGLQQKRSPPLHAGVHAQSITTI